MSGGAQYSDYINILRVSPVSRAELSLSLITHLIYCLLLDQDQFQPVRLDTVSEPSSRYFAQTIHLLLHVISQGSQRCDR